MELPHVDIFSADGNGVIKGLGSGRSFLIQPSGLTPGTPFGLTALIGARQFPMPMFAGGGQLELTEDFSELSFKGCTPFGTYLCGVFPPGSKYRNGGKVLAVAALPLANNPWFGGLLPNGVVPTPSSVGITVYSTWRALVLVGTSPGTPAISQYNRMPFSVAAGSGWWQVQNLANPGDYVSNTLLMFASLPIPGGQIFLSSAGSFSVQEIDVIYEVNG